MGSVEKKTKIWVKFMKVGHMLGCHQRPDRSFFIKGYQFPLCARCTGVLAGEIFTLLTFWFLFIPVIFLMFFPIPMAIDWIRQEKYDKESTNKRRFITGFFAGIALGYLHIMLIIALVALII